MQRFYSRPTQIGDILCVPSTGGASHSVGSTPTEGAPRPNHAQDCGKLLLNRADIDRHRLLSLFGVGGVLSRIDTNDHTVDTVLTSDESLWVKAGPRPVSQRRDRQQEGEEDGKREMTGNDVLPTPSFLLNSASLLAQVAGSGQASSRRGQSSPKAWTNAERCGGEKSSEDCSTARKIQVREPRQPRQVVAVGARPHLLACLPLLCPGRRGSSGLCPWRSFACRLKTKMRI